MAGQDKKGSLNAPIATKDKLDLNLSPPYFLTPISNNKVQEIFTFDTQEGDDSASISSIQDFTGLDDCIYQSCKNRNLFYCSSYPRPSTQTTEDRGLTRNSVCSFQYITTQSKAGDCQSGTR